MRKRMGLRAGVFALQSEMGGERLPPFLSRFQNVMTFLPAYFFPWAKG